MKKRKFRIIPLSDESLMEQMNVTVDFESETIKFGSEVQPIFCENWNWFLLPSVQELFGFVVEETALSRKGKL